MFWIKNKKNRLTIANPSFSIKIKVGFQGLCINFQGHFFLMGVIVFLTLAQEVEMFEAHER